MPTRYEQRYCNLIREVIQRGHVRHTRNGKTISMFGGTLAIPNATSSFLLLKGRKIFYKGVLGELAAFIRGPKHINDFKKFGCNYWDKFAKPDGSIDVDYGNQWIDFNGVNQLQQLVQGILKDPMGRRHIVNSWRPDRLDEVTLPCCHFLYQFYVDHDKLSLLWYQRSVDVMIGLPSDVILAQVMLLLVAQQTGYLAGEIVMHFGDTHIYEDHFKDHAVENYLCSAGQTDASKIVYTLAPEANIYDGFLFEPSHLTVHTPYDPPVINFELKV